MSIKIEVANSTHKCYAKTICKMMEEAAKIRGTGIAKRKPAYLEEKMAQEQAIIALNDNEVIRFSYIESWEEQKYVAHSGLMVHPNFRKTGLAKAIKEAIFELSKKKFPTSTIFDGLG